jgi:repressor LexA
MPILRKPIGRPVKSNIFIKKITKIMTQITKRQKQTLDFIKTYRAKHEYAPSLEEIKRYLKLASVSTAHHHVKTLEAQGYLRKDENQPRGISVFPAERMVQIPLMGLISAGQPIMALEQKETLAVPRNRLPRELNNIYALKVVGQSMIDENINDGDIVLVRHQTTAANGEKVVALLDNADVTLKTFFRERGQIRLQPANRKMEPIIVRRGNTGFAIQGVVIDVVKNFGIAGTLSEVFSR